jgi:sensor histidine kinase YesM
MVENSKPPAVVNQVNQGGIGLKNVQKRLDLIYGKNYALKIDDDFQKFVVELKIMQPNEPVFIQ